MSGNITHNLIPRLCRFNQDIIKQKSKLLNLLLDKYGQDSTFKIFQFRCPIVHASIGQHFRHSMDHIERAVDAAAATAAETIDTIKKPARIEYDVRDRGCLDETDYKIALHRMQHVSSKLEKLKLISSTNLSDETVITNFILSGNTDNQYPLTSTVGRELGFSGHHAIHHMAMVRIIVSNDHSQRQLLNIEELPVDLGKAPSTSNFENTITNEEQ